MKLQFTGKSNYSKLYTQISNAAEKLHEGKLSKYTNFLLIKFKYLNPDENVHLLIFQKRLRRIQH